MDPILHLCQPRLDIFPVAERAALPAQQQLVEELHIDKGEELLEELSDQKRRDVVAAQGVEEGVKHAQDLAPVGAQLGDGCAGR